MFLRIEIKSYNKDNRCISLLTGTSTSMYFLLRSLLTQTALLPLCTSALIKDSLEFCELASLKLHSPRTLQLLLLAWNFHIRREKLEWVNLYNRRAQQSWSRCHKCAAITRNRKIVYSRILEHFKT